MAGSEFDVDRHALAEASHALSGSADDLRHGYLPETISRISAALPESMSGLGARTLSEHWAHDTQGLGDRLYDHAATLASLSHDVHRVDGVLARAAGPHGVVL